jgi:LysR family transcriptional activator of mexEF-oprN operon
LSVKILRGDNRPGPLTLDEFCERPHALVSFSGDLTGAIDTDLARIAARAGWCWRCRNLPGCAPCWRAPTCWQRCRITRRARWIEGSSLLRADDAPFEIKLVRTVHGLERRQR